MNIFWVFSSKQEGLLGLYDYKAATIGDGICFPILVGTLLYTVKKSDILNKRQHMWCNILGLLMACLGILMQISWLRDNNITPNWTTSLSKLYLIRVLSQNTENTVSNGNKISCFLIWFSSSFFLLLHIYDDYKEKYNIVLMKKLNR